MNRNETLNHLCSQLTILLAYHGIKGSVKLEVVNNFYVLTFKAKLPNDTILRVFLDEFTNHQTTFSFEALPNDYVKFYHVEPC